MTELRRLAAASLDVARTHVVEHKGSVVQMPARLHGLRHTVGTIMREAGFDRDTIADMLGQETAGMAEW